MKKFAMGFLGIIMMAGVCFGITMHDWCWNAIQGKKACVVVSSDGCVNLEFDNCSVSAPFPFGFVKVELGNDTEECFYKCDMYGLSISCEQWNLEILCLPNLEFPNYLLCNVIVQEPFVIVVEESDNADVANETLTGNETVISDNETSDNSTGE